MTNTVIVYLIKGNKIALGRKSTGHGIGKWNGFGGKIEKGESAKKTATRELFEESGITVAESDLTKAAEILYKEGYDWLVTVFTASKFTGELILTKEMEPAWFNYDKIPYDQMWANDKLWLPKILAGENFSVTFWHDKKGNILKHEFRKL